MLFLILQAVLLCATVQAGPVAADSLASDIASHFQPGGCGHGVSIDDTDGDDDQQNAGAFRTQPTAAAASGFSPREFFPQSLRGAANGIRAPPSQA
ncbi:hypothetical protein [Microbulbifer magnicolonia]|uniref:hypothetical protein n=1 Tax=Microbulbifer magnicolonia TaxID=3109744 RepID=UPI002B412527|nr:hypothetical protein [Microbulbifer sp. GG15]